MKIYNVKQIDHVKYGRFEYWVTDGTGKGWTLRTDNEYKLGDVLVIQVKGS